MLTRALIFGGGRGEATLFARRAAGELPAELADERQGLLAQERIAGYMHDLPDTDWRRGPEPEVSGDGIGARFLATTLAWEATLDGFDRARAVEPARFGAAGDRLMRIDVGHLWAVAGIVLELADEETEPVLARGHGSLSAPGVNLRPEDRLSVVRLLPVASGRTAGGAAGVPHRQRDRVGRRPGLQQRLQRLLRRQRAGRTG